MKYRDDRDAVRQRADNLEEQLAEANQRLAEARKEVAAQQKKDVHDERRLAELGDEVNALRGQLGLPESRVPKRKSGFSTPITVGLISLAVLAVMAAVAVLTMVMMQGSPTEPTTSSSLPLLLAGGLFLLFGGIMEAMAFYAFKKNSEIKKWPRAAGTVRSSRIETSSGIVKDQHGYNQVSTSHTPEVLYTYTVDGRQYDGNAVTRVAVSTSSKSKVQECIDKYPAGAEIMVFYDPDDPSTGYLEVGRSIGGIIMLVFGAFFVIPGVVLLVAFIMS